MKPCTVSLQMQLNAANERASGLEKDKEEMFDLMCEMSVSLMSTWVEADNFIKRSEKVMEEMNKDYVDNLRILQEARKYRTVNND